MDIDVRFDRGFWPDEQGDGQEPFRWMGATGVISFAPADVETYLELKVSTPLADGSQQLVSDTAPLVLAHGVSLVSVVIPPGRDHVHVASNRIIPLESHPDDPRALAVCVHAAARHASRDRHDAIVGQHANAVLNVQEMLGRHTTLSSTPRVLGIDLYGACNVKPPCVYCEWDWNKQLEGAAVDLPFDDRTLAALGPIYANAANLVNCSIGEPFMMKNIDALLDEFAAQGKALDMTSNGQILTDTNIAKLVGRDIDLYVSLDAATPETYARLRNNRFPALVANLKRLVAAKGGAGRLPRLNLVFMPMRANQHELDAFVALAAEIGADRAVLRPLNFADRLDLKWDRAGYHFDYQRELLPMDELIWISGRAQALCRAAGVALSDQLDFGGALSAQFQQQFDAGVRSVAPPAAPPGVVRPPAPPPPQASPAPQAAVADAPPAVTAPPTDAPPLCTEPWKSLYVLRRGVFPCCYGAQPLAPMTDAAATWNAPALVEIRDQLSRGRFPAYCLDSPACPIVRKHEEARVMTTVDAWRLKRRHAASAIHRAFTRVQWTGQWAWLRAKRIVTEPAYVKHHLRRIFGR